MKFSKEAFRKNASRGVQKMLARHIDVLDGKAVAMKEGQRFGSIEYDIEGQEFELYPVMSEWCKEEQNDAGNESN